MLKVNYFRYSSWKSRAKSCLKCSNVLVDKDNVRSSTRISTRTTFALNIHKWSSQWNKLIMKNICWWYILFSNLYDIHKSASKHNDGLEKVSVRLISGNCSLIQILPNRLMKLFSLEKQVQITYHIHLSNLTRLTFLKAPIKST